VPVVFGSSAGSDDALVAIEEEAATPLDAEPCMVHRNESRGGSAGPGWIATQYVLPTRRPTSVRTVVVLIGGVEVRVHLVRGGSRLRIRDGGAAFGVDGDDTFAIATDEAASIASVGGGGRIVAIRALLGLDRVGVSGSGSGRMNLVHDRSAHPWVEERLASARSRVVASATVASVDRPATAVRRLGAVEVAHAEGGMVTIRTNGAGSAETAAVDVSARPATRTEMAGRTVHGPALRVVVARDDGSAFAGERIASIDGVLTLARPGIVAVRQDGGAVDATVAAGIRLDPAWAGDGLARIRVRDGSGPFGPPIRLEESGVLADRIVRGHARRLGSRLVTVRFERA
jgi:hypothetical protein